ncbi:hypothetical protein H6F87_26365 [Cyanobacteria bacterium FACHB-502]|uniref:hypothetical protein n=1 Tax=Leptolyngbya sp. GB1-A1 TaxID=2933908 RepID=UPI0019C25F7B|nr:hypothetical protein [Cyanobacteria bacterium FACHB-502]
MKSGLRPDVISIHYNGEEVCRCERGRWIEVPLPPSFNPAVLPHRVQFFFDGQMVYDLNRGVVERNELRD